MIWIIGEYSGRIDNAPQLLEDFRKNFLDEPAQVPGVVRRHRCPRASAAPICLNICRCSCSC